MLRSNRSSLAVAAFAFVLMLGACAGGPTSPAIGNLDRCLPSADRGRGHDTDDGSLMCPEVP
jgi:hypothetical protein